MVKFSREYEASIIPEWKAAFVDYKGLKKLVKRIKIARRDAAPQQLARREAGAGRSRDGDGSNASSGSYGFSVLDPVRALAAHFAATPASPVRRRVVLLAAARVCSCRTSSPPPPHTYIYSSRTCLSE